jgi:hypothetical protein
MSKSSRSTSRNQKIQTKPTAQNQHESELDGDDEPSQKGKLRTASERKSSQSQDSGDESPEASPPPKRQIKSRIGGKQIPSPEPSRGKIRTKIGGKPREASHSPSPRKMIKSRIGGAKVSRENSPTHDAQDKGESDKIKKEPVSQVQEMTAEEKALEKRKQLQKELEDKRGKETKKRRRF